MTVPVIVKSSGSSPPESESFMPPTTTPATRTTARAPIPAATKGWSRRPGLMGLELELLVLLISRCGSGDVIVNEYQANAESVVGADSRFPVRQLHRPIHAPVSRTRDGTR